MHGKQQSRIVNTALYTLRGNSQQQMPAFILLLHVLKASVTLLSRYPLTTLWSAWLITQSILFLKLEKAAQKAKAQAHRHFTHELEKMAWAFI